jgi:hypothetical protein
MTKTDILRNFHKCCKTITSSNLSVEQQNETIQMISEFKNVLDRQWDTMIDLDHITKTFKGSNSIANIIVRIRDKIAQDFEEEHFFK